MDYNNQVLAEIDDRIWNADTSRMYTSLVAAAQSTLIGSLENSTIGRGYETYKLLSSVIPNLEVVVVDPNCLYTSEDSDSSVTDNDSNEDLDESELSSVIPKSEELTKISKIHPTEETINDLAQSLLNHNFVESTHTHLKEVVELIDGFFDSVTLDIEEEEEDILLREINENFELASYITEQSASLISKVNTTNSVTQDNKKVADNFTVHPMDKAQNIKFTTERRERKTLKRGYIEESSGSEDDCKKTKKRRVEDDPLWMPSEKSKTTSNNKLDVRTTIYKKKMPTDNQDIHIEVPKCIAKNEKNVENTKVSRNTYGIGRGKNMALLTKCYNRTTSSDDSNYDDNENKSMDGNRRSKKSFKEAITSINNGNKVKDHQYQRNYRKNENRYNKAESGNKKSKCTVEDDLSDFGKAIVTSMAIVPTLKRSETKRNILQVQSRLNRFQEHSVKFQLYLKDKEAKSKIPKSLKLRGTVKHIAVTTSELLKTGIVEDMESQRKMKADDCDTLMARNEQSTKKRITIQDYQSRKSMQSSPSSNSDCSSKSNPVMKRKISVKEYLNRKATQSA